MVEEFDVGVGNCLNIEPSVGSLLETLESEAPFEKKDNSF